MEMERFEKNHLKICMCKGERENERDRMMNKKIRLEKSPVLLYKMTTLFFNSQSVFLCKIGSTSSCCPVEQRDIYKRRVFNATPRQAAMLRNRKNYNYCIQAVQGYRRFGTRLPPLTSSPLPWLPLPFAQNTEPRMACPMLRDAASWLP